MEDCRLEPGVGPLSQVSGSWPALATSTAVRPVLAASKLILVSTQGADVGGSPQCPGGCFGVAAASLPAGRLCLLYPVNRSGNRCQET